MLNKIVLLLTIVVLCGANPLRCKQKTKHVGCGTVLTTKCPSRIVTETVPNRIPSTILHIECDNTNTLFDSECRQLTKLLTVRKTSGSKNFEDFEQPILVKIGCEFVKPIGTNLYSSTSKINN